MSPRLPARRPPVEALLAWYDAHARELPWRGNADPYRVWVSEIMLQQTRVEAVEPYYERFLARFPTAEALASAPEPEVLEAWAGLGYYRRARLLQSAARRLRDEHDGAFPADYAAIRALPGVGDYTAGAIASIAFDLPRAAVDGNVLRVFSRLLDEPGNIAKLAIRRRLADEAQRWMDAAPEGRRGALTQALMEIGAMVCTPRSPRCLVCPLQAVCRARKRGTQAERPAKCRAPKLLRVDLAVALVWRGDRLLMRQRPADEAVMPGFWEAPTAEGGPGSLAEYGIGTGAPVARFRHGITFRDYRGTVYEGRLAGRPRGGFRWLGPGERRAAPVSTITRKALAAAGLSNP